MQFRDMKISTQLRIGIGATILIVIGLGSLAGFQTNTLWQTGQGCQTYWMKHEI